MEKKRALSKMKTKLRKISPHSLHDCHRSFEALKGPLTTGPLLIYPNSNKQLIRYTDASDTCIGGGWLTQPFQEKESLIAGVKEVTSIYFLSHRLSSAQQKWPYAIMQKAYSISYVLQKLDGPEFVIETDHKTLKYLRQSRLIKKDPKVGLAVEWFHL